MSHPCYFRTFMYPYSSNAFHHLYTTIWIWTKRTQATEGSRLWNAWFIVFLTHTTSRVGVKLGKILKLDSWKFWSGVEVTSIILNESYTLKASEYPIACQCGSILNPASESARPRSPMRYREWQNFRWHIRCQHVCRPILCKQLHSGSWDGNTKIHLFLVLLLYSHKRLLIAYYVSRTLLGIELTILFLASRWSFPSYPHKSQWYHS